jgi:hypothetical protein
VKCKPCWPLQTIRRAKHKGIAYCRVCALGIGYAVLLERAWVPSA